MGGVRKLEEEWDKSGWKKQEEIEMKEALKQRSLCGSVLGPPLPYPQTACGRRTDRQERKMIMALF
jgi:hypothetical protein